MLVSLTKSVVDDRAAFDLAKLVIHCDTFDGACDEVAKKNLPDSRQKKKVCSDQMTGMPRQCFFLAQIAYQRDFFLSYSDTSERTPLR